MAEKKKRVRNPDYKQMPLELHKDMISGLHIRREQSGNRKMVEFLRPYFTKIIKGEI